MKLSKKTTIKVSPVQANIIGHLCYASGKLWNVANYQRRCWTKDSGEDYPNWYVQKKALKDSFWYKNLPAQSAQETLKILDGAWKSFYALKKSGGVENPRPPRFKQDGFQVTFLQNGIKKTGGRIVRLSLPKQLRAYLKKAYGIGENFLFLENSLFGDIDAIKQIKLEKPEDGKVETIVIYEVPDAPKKNDNGHWLGIDLGVSNPFTCVDSATGESFILGREYFSKARFFDKKIAHYQSINAAQQAARGVKYPGPSRRVLALYKKKNNALHDYLHKCTKEIANYCEEHDITRVVIGDITGIRKGNDHGAKQNQKLHSLPYEKIYHLLEYKLALRGITLIRQEESYTSQVPPSAPEVSEKYAAKGNRRKRGLHFDGRTCYNADGVGAYNILKKYSAKLGTPFVTPADGIKSPHLIKVAA